MKPSEKEQEYIARMELEKKKRLEEAKRRRDEGRETEKPGEPVSLKCPKCGQNLFEYDYRGVKIDKCQGCEGIWLDAGELDQLNKLEAGALDKLFSIFRR